jgi:branched-chain amino acid transport system permease protein
MGLLQLQIVNGITIGMIYGLAALGFTMVYKALGYLNFSHSNTITIGAFVEYTIVTTCNISFLAAMPIVILCMLFYGFILEKCIFKQFRAASPLTFMLVSISLSTVVSNICLLVFGPQPRALTNVFPSVRLSVGGLTIPFNNVCIFIIAILSLVVLQLFFSKTKFGLSLRLASEDPKTASLMGIKVLRTRAATFAITAALGGIAGMLFSPLYSVTIELGSSLALKTFIAAVVGGLGDFVGAVAGGLLVGVIESLSSTYISSAYKDLIVYVVGILVLAIFPYGIFRRVTTKH